MKVNTLIGALWVCVSMSTFAMDNTPPRNKKRKRQEVPLAPRKKRPTKKEIISKNLFEAAKNGDIAEVEYFLAQGQNPNKAEKHQYTHCLDWGKTPLIIAVKMGHKLIVQRLLDASADPNQQITHGFDEGTTPLYWAVKSVNIHSRKIYISIIKLLLDRGAQVDSLNYHPVNGFPGEEVTPLWLAVEKRDVEVMQLLLAHGANVNYAPTEGTNRNVTPVYIAACYGHIKMLYHLLKKNATVYTLQAAYDLIKVSSNEEHILCGKILRYCYLIEQLIEKNPEQKTKFEMQFDQYVYAQLMLGTQSQKTKVRNMCWNTVLHTNIFLGKFGEYLGNLAQKK